jgi:hypothetical protein
MNVDTIDVNKIPIDENVIFKWQEIVDWLSIIFQVPAALIMHVDEPNIEVFRANKDDLNPFKEKQVYKLAGLYCEEVIKSKKKLLVPNALNDKRWDHNPDLEFGMVSYLGYPIIWPDNTVFGTICISDMVENEYNEDIEKIMVQYKEIIESHLDLIYKSYIAQRSLEDYRKKDNLLQKKVSDFESERNLLCDRELMIFNLQNEVDELRKKFGLPPKYDAITSDK